MHKIFENNEKNKNSKKKGSPFPILKSRGESEKDRQLRILEGFLDKKLSKNYVDKLTVLLHNSKNKLNYSEKRNNIKKAIYKLDENNELYLTLPKLRNKGNKVGANNYTKTETTEYSNNKKTSDPSPKKYLDDDDILDESIKEILYDNEGNNKTNKKEEEEKGKILFEQLKTKYDNFDIEDNNPNSPNKNIYNKKAKYRSLPKLQKKQIPSEYKLIATPKQISEFDYNLGKSFVNGNLRYLTKLQKEKLAYIAELNLFNSIDRLKEKENIIKEIKQGSKSKKKLLMPIDFFNYDAQKWKKITEERNKNYNNIVISQLNKENKERLEVMKENVGKLNVEAFLADKEVNKAINNINYFLSRYGAEAASDNSSKKSFRRLTSKKKDKKTLREEKKVA